MRKQQYFPPQYGDQAFVIYKSDQAKQDWRLLTVARPGNGHGHKVRVTINNTV
ncbi:hypothetical protein ACLOAU_21595 [Niabella sp. CJ426]|uniref:hypothetical protein n=1 Tax=Niabella sp. CJ426 TaxID=3393740 RepID=UPI003D0892CA